MQEEPLPADAVTITACPDGPLLVRGPVVLRVGGGRTIDSHRRTVALCRCGMSGIKPFCDGTHKVSGFRTGEEPVPSERS